jgi:seryl-tRNA synthetase
VYLSLISLFCLGAASYFLAATSHPEDTQVQLQQLILLGQVVLLVGLIVAKVSDWFFKGREREWLKEDAAAKHKETLAKIKENTDLTEKTQSAVASEAKDVATTLANTVKTDRETLLAHIKELTDAANAAFKEANNLNAKLVLIGEERIRNGNEPTKVEVVNDIQHPVPVTGESK